MDLEKHRNKNGTINGVSALSEFTGLSQNDVKSIFQDVQDNNAKLNSCPYHEFEPNPDEFSDRAINRHKRYICKCCGGHVSDVMYRWHELGRRAKP